ncbi:membrane protein RL12 [Panine betaherpesvirus 2]|uniref:Membrane protein RL12 n=1 Tax=Panine betaherpesvirus 2 TaxID=188763 RepID=Q8QS85_9BETA|nr:membrane protein RL12 [Panine betaherpesvirus 2]AAM00652.1 membrane protein RL12 [Panine betaherpesvirus 2]QXV67754.1 membrane protein RL12 [Panine betaherpesvirus 2]
MSETCSVATTLLLVLALSQLTEEDNTTNSSVNTSTNDSNISFTTTSSPKATSTSPTPSFTPNLTTSTEYLNSTVNSTHTPTLTTTLPTSTTSTHSFQNTTITEYSTTYNLCNTTETVSSNSTESITATSSCNTANTTFDNTTISTAIQTTTTEIVIKAVWTTVHGKESENVTLHVNSTFQNCTRTVWNHPYNITIHKMRKENKPHTLCEASSGHSVKHNHHKLCLQCTPKNLTLFDLMVNHSGKYIAECDDGQNHAQQGFILTVNATHITNYTRVCQPDKDTVTTRPISTHLFNQNYSYQGHYPGASANSHRGAMAVGLFLMACVLLFFARRVYKKKYRPLRDDVSESEFVVRYTPEHED